MAHAMIEVQRNSVVYPARQGWERRYQRSAESLHSVLEWRWIEARAARTAPSVALKGIPSGKRRSRRRYRRRNGCRGEIGRKGTQTCVETALSIYTGLYGQFQAPRAHVS